MVCPSSVIIWAFSPLSAAGISPRSGFSQLTSTALILLSPNPDCDLSVLDTPASVPLPSASGSEVPAMTQTLISLQNMKMVPVPEKAYGTFFEGDCYIILHVSRNGEGWSLGGNWFNPSCLAAVGPSVPSPGRAARGWKWLCLCAHRHISHRISVGLCQEHSVLSEAKGQRN